MGKETSTSDPVQLSDDDRRALRQLFDTIENKKEGFQPFLRHLRSHGFYARASQGLPIEKELEDFISGMLQKLQSLNEMPEAISQLALTQNVDNSRRKLMELSRSIRQRIGSMDGHEAALDSFNSLATSLTGALDKMNTLTGESLLHTERLVEEPSGHLSGIA